MSQAFRLIALLPYCPIALPRLGYPAPGTRYRINAEDRTPSTEDRARPPENAHTGFASCIPHVWDMKATDSRELTVSAERSQAATGISGTGVRGAIARASFYRTGRGEPLLWLPSAQGHWRFYDLWADTLASRFDVLVPTLRGERDFEPTPDFDWDLLVDDVLADMVTVGWRQAWIGGASFGAALALVCLSRAPERFKGAFLYGTPWDRPGPWLRRVIRWMDRRRAWDRLGRVFRWWAFLTLAPEVLRLPRSLRDSYRQWFFERWPRYSVPMAVLGRRIALLSSLADHVRLDRIDLPVWVLAGARDRLVRPRYQQALARRLPRAVFVCIPGVGHLAPQTHPSVLAGWITRLLTL
jgi:pimeloyl-ACP methyl ester carboxylesterase